MALILFPSSISSPSSTYSPHAGNICRFRGAWWGEELLLLFSRSPLENQELEKQVMSIVNEVNLVGGASPKLNRRPSVQGYEASLCSRIWKTVKNLGAFFYPSFQSRDWILGLTALLSIIPQCSAPYRLIGRHTWGLFASYVTLIFSSSYGLMFTYPLSHHPRWD